MLELWKYENGKSNNSESEVEYIRCREIANRLLGKEGKRREEVTESDFLKKDFAYAKT